MMDQYRSVCPVPRPLAQDGRLPDGKPAGEPLRAARRWDDQGSKRVQVHGPFGPLILLTWEMRMRADMHTSFAAREAEARRPG
jgi:hypothetical protein